MGTDKATARSWIKSDMPSKVCNITGVMQLVGYLDEESNKKNYDLVLKAVNRDHLFEEMLFSLEYSYRKLNELVKAGKISEPILLDEIPELLKKAKAAV